MPSNSKYYPLLKLLSDKHGWETHPTLRTWRDFSCQTIQVHGSKMTDSMYREILTGIYAASQKAQQETNDCDLLTKYIELDERIRIICKLD